MKTEETKSNKYEIIRDVCLNFRNQHQIFLTLILFDEKVFFEAHSRMKLIVRKLMQNMEQAELVMALCEHRLKKYSDADDAELFLHNSMSYNDAIDYLFALRVRDKYFKYSQLQDLFRKNNCNIKVEIHSPPESDDLAWPVSIYVTLPGQMNPVGIFRGRFLQEYYYFFFA